MSIGGETARWLAGAMALATTACDAGDAPLGAKPASPDQPDGRFALRAAAIAAVQRDADPSFALSLRGPGVAAAVNHAHGLEVRVDVGATLHVAPLGADGWRAAMRVEGVGRDGSPEEMGERRIGVEGNRAVISFDGGEAFFVNGPLGVEHGFDLTSAPEGDGPLAVTIAVEGLVPILESARAATLRGAGVPRGVRYTDLFAQDAAGRELPSWLEVAGSKLKLRVDDTGARYPVHVDPLVWLEDQRLDTADGTSDDELGYAVSLDGDTALIGAFRHPSFGASGGAAYFFERQAGIWSERQKVMASDGAEGQRFGHAVALEGDTAIVGASRAAYVFGRTAGVWSEQQKLVAPDAPLDVGFGDSLALSGDAVVVGAPGHAEGGFKAGAVYFFRRNGTWSFEQKVLASDATPLTELGRSVALEADRALVGAPGDDDGGDPGGAYVLERIDGAWVETAKLAPTPALQGNRFGRAVALDGQRAAVGSPHHNDAFEPGAAYLFVLDGGVWAQEQELLPADGFDSMLFGYALDLEGDFVLVGALLDNEAGAETGSVYTFRREVSGWTAAGKLLVSDAAPSDLFGAAISISGDTALLGFHWEDNENGRAWVYRLIAVGEPCDGPGDCATGFCVDGVCCDGPCGGGADDCVACSVVLGAASDGTCAPTTGTACEDGVFCNGRETCQEGVCTDGADPCPGPDDDDDCVESCDEAAEDCAAMDPDGVACTDGIFCNGYEACQAGDCVGLGIDPCPGPDGDADCSESCDEGAQTCTAADPDRATCDDGSACTLADSCFAGGCLGLAPVQCPAPAECRSTAVCSHATGRCGEEPVAPDGTPCAAGTCVSGSCQGAAGGSGSGGEQPTTTASSSATSGGPAASGPSSTAGSGGSGSSPDEDDERASSPAGGCGCRTSPSVGLPSAPLVMLAASLVLTRRIRRRRGAVSTSPSRPAPPR